MKQAFGILLLALAVPAGQTALAQVAQQVVEPEGDDVSKLPERLETFVNEAIDEGLLTPARPDAPAGQASPAPQGESAAGQPRQITLPAAPTPSRPAPVVLTCHEEDPLDFSAYSEMATYQDFFTWREAQAAAEAPASDAAVARAYLSLGLNEEARLQLKGASDPESEALRRFAGLMEGRKAPDVASMRKLADCHASAGLWHAAALLAARQREGAGLMEVHLPAYRDLPLQLRAEVAMLSVPVLDQMGDEVLVRKLMREFTRDEIAGSSDLVFLKAMLAMEPGGEEAERTLRRYLLTPEHRVLAVSALLMHGAAVEEEYRKALSASLLAQVERLSKEQAVNASLDVMLKDLDETADYPLLRKLAAMPATQTEQTRTLLADHMVRLLRRDLASEARIDQLAALDGLQLGLDLLEGRSEREALIETAVEVAAELGLRQVAETLAAEAESEEAVAYARAALAARVRDYDTLKTLAEAHKGNASVTRLAAVEAIRQGDAETVSKLEPRLELDGETVLAVIEADAATGAWILSENVYAAAREVEDEALQHRISRVLSLREGRAARPPVSSRMSDVPGRLNQIGLSLQSNATEAH